jgi:hypothetical protein
MWLLRRLAPDFKTIADFRRDNGAAVGRRLWPFADPHRPGIELALHQSVALFAIELSGELEEMAQVSRGEHDFQSGNQTAASSLPSR